MSYVPFSHTGDRYRYELTRAEVASLRELLRERRHRLYVEANIFHYYDSRYEDDVLEEMVRCHRRSIERILRENKGFFPDQYLTTRRTNSSSPSAPEAIIPNQEPSPEAKMRKTLLDLLWSRPVGLIHDHLSKSRIKSSGEWIFALPAFESWRKATTESPKGVERGENCLWLQGSLGAGKTMLM